MFDHRRAGGEVGQQQLGQIERRGDAHRQGIGEFLPGAIVNAFHQWEGVVDQIIHVPAFFNHGRRETLQIFLLRHVAHEPAAQLDVDDVHRGAFPAKSVGNGPADAVGPAGDDCDLSLHANPSVHHGCFQSLHQGTNSPLITPRTSGSDRIPYFSGCRYLSPMISPLRWFLSRSRSRAPR